MAFTAKEIVVLGSAAGFMNYETAAAEKRDNVVAFEYGELAAAAEMEIKSVRGIVASLIKKGSFVITAEGLIGITDEGIDQVYAIGEAGVEAVAEAAGQDQASAEAAVLHEAVEALGARMARLSKCQALRETAKSFTAGRAVFLKAAEAVGINAGTAARQWQEARGKEPAPANDEDKAALVAYFVANMAHDELAELLVERMSRAEVKKALETISAEV